MSLNNLTRVRANSVQDEITNTVLRLEHAAVEDFKEVVAVRIGKRVWETYYPGHGMITAWKTDLHGILPVIVTDDYEIGVEVR